MAYSDAAAVRELVIGIDSTVMSDADVLLHIAKADALINSFVGAVYALPFATTPPLVASLSAEITAYYVMRTQFTRDAINSSEYLKEFEKAMKILEDIRDGKLLLFNASNVELGKSGNIIKSNNQDYNPTFDMADTLDQNVDARLIKDIATAREAED
jgi:phage gp36-like protein